MPGASEVVHVGGSSAQRELMDDMLVLALMWSGNATEAGTLLDRACTADRRRATRPGTAGSLPDVDRLASRSRPA